MSPDETRVVLRASGDRDVVLKLVFMYTRTPREVLTVYTWPRKIRVRSLQ